MNTNETLALVNAELAFYNEHPEALAAFANERASRIYMNKAHSEPYAAEFVARFHQFTGSPAERWEAFQRVKYHERSNRAK